MNLYLGCPIWSFKGWLGNFYPKGTPSADYLREYAHRLTTIEGNTTFYAIPAEKTIGQWNAQTPASFRFCPKVPRTISHNGNLIGHIGEAEYFVEIMGQLGVRLGPMFLQLPPGYSPARFEDLKGFLEASPSKARLGGEVPPLDWFDAPPPKQLAHRLSDHPIQPRIIVTPPTRPLAAAPSLTTTASPPLP